MLDAALMEYGEVNAGFVCRATWYAVCRAVADIAFGIQEDRPVYLHARQKSLEILKAEFAAELDRFR